MDQLQDTVRVIYRFVMAKANIRFTHGLANIHMAHILQIHNLVGTSIIN